jgi:dTDP-4-dehydrorhamnose reductase
MKVFITGGSGQLGEFINVEFSNSNHNFLSTYNIQAENCKNYPSVKIDLTDHKEVKKIIFEYKPDAVIHTAAISNPAKCDLMSKSEVMDVNVYAPKFIASLSNEIGAKFIFTSTDLVYDGKQGSLLSENSELNPLSFYSESKLRAEEEIKMVTGDFVILRTALLYGIGISNSENYFHKVFNSFSNGKSMKLFTDQFRSPLALHDAARLIKEIIDMDIKGEILNFGGNERVSRKMLGEILCESAGFDKSLIEEITMDDTLYKDKVEDVSMDNSKLRSFGLNPKSIKESVMEILK